jgi:hypothetical protein
VKSEKINFNHSIPQSFGIENQQASYVEGNFVLFYFYLIGTLEEGLSQIPQSGWAESFTPVAHKAY